MLPWIRDALHELNEAYRLSQERVEKAVAAHAVAESERNDAIGERNALYNLLRDLKDYATAQEEGGAP